MSPVSASPSNSFFSSPSTYKALVKSRVIDYWETSFRSNAQKLTSLKYFKFNFYSLKHPHPIFSTAGSNPFEVKKSTIQASMLCAMYNCEDRVKHWSLDNRQGFCSAPSCVSLQVPGNIQHILQDCIALDDTRAKMLVYIQDCLYKFPHISHVLKEYADPHSSDFIQFILDCSSLPLVIQSYQTQGKYILNTLFKITRTFCFSMHRAYKIIRTQNYIL